MPIAASGNPIVNVPPLWLASALLAGAALPAALGLRALRRRRWLGAGLALGNAALLLGAGLFLLLLMAQVHTYRRLTDEVPVATLSVEALGPRLYRVVLDDGQRLGLYRLRGDQWRLDAQVLVWHGPMRLLGLPPLYRLERLSGRYRDPILELHAPRSVHDLRPAGPLPDWLTVPLERLPGADTRYGSSAYMDLEDGARYAVRLTPTGLIARRLP